MDSDEDVAFDDELDYASERDEEEGDNQHDDQEDHIDVDEEIGGRAPIIHNVSTPKICTPDSGDYDVLSPDQICTYMNDVVKEVNQVIQQPPTTTRLLLSQYKWDKEKLIEKYYEDTEKIFESCHVMSPVAKMQFGRRNGSSGECDICFMAVRSNDFKGTDCGHRFCTSCWKQYLTNKILNENISDKIECPAHGCNILLDDVFVMDMIGNQPSVKRKYLHGITNSFVLAHRSIRWCPGTDCLYAIRVVSPEWMSVICTKCHTTFCFLCAEPWHDPVPCTILKRWKKKCADDSETSNWLVANTKECPNCHATIEKDGGCNHVVCKNLACKGEFCWVCLGQWAAHGSSWFKCNRYSEEESKMARSAQEKSRAALQRYLFYFNRYINHQNSLRLETKLHNSVRIKMEEMQQHNMSWIEVQFLQKAVNVLQHCRQTLMFTYVFAFYLKKNNQQVLFEDNQSDLETATETLSGYLERDMTSQESVGDIKQKVQDKANYCESRRRVLVEHVHEGYEKDWWEFD